MTMFVRKYQPGEEMELWKLRFDTIRNVNLGDYTSEQVQAWASDEVDEQQWVCRIGGINPYVCVHDDVIVGYADIQESGLIDHFFVHHQWQGKGVGGRLFATIESDVTKRGLGTLTANVSITAKPFFESRGFGVAAPQDVRLGTVVLRNYRMVKRLGTNRSTCG